MQTHDDDDDDDDTNNNNNNNGALVKIQYQYNNTHKRYAACISLQATRHMTYDISNIPWHSSEGIIII